MNTQPITPELLASSVIAVPPLARDEDYSLSKAQNLRLVKHLEAGGVTTLLYGGNANLYHIKPSEYLALLEMLEEISSAGTTVVPAVGPSYGVMMDQAEMLRGSDYPTVMILPQVGLTTEEGVQRGIRHFAEAVEKPVVVYLKNEGYLTVDQTKELVDDGLVSWIKYAIVRDNPSEDAVLSELVDKVDPNIVVSGIGEQPAIVHLRDFGVGGFTSGCVCLAPRLSMTMLKQIKNGDYTAAEETRGIFKRLEDLRNEINPIRVLHDAVTYAGISDVGPMLPLLSDVEEADRSRVREAAQTLFAEN
tara:strand:- start:4602 stop:5513 length:912 start_codon:yes stop_codon:yes gene_type:complete